MDPKILDSLIKLGSSGGLLTVIAILLYVIYNQYTDLKALQQARVDDKEKCQEHLSDQMDKNHDVLDKVVTTMEKLQIQQEARFDAVDKDNAALKDHIKDFKHE